jgi:hypothetical protein
MKNLKLFRTSEIVKIVYCIIILGIFLQGCVKSIPFKKDEFSNLDKEITIIPSISVNTPGTSSWYCASGNMRIPLMVRGEDDFMNLIKNKLIEKWPKHPPFDSIKEFKDFYDPNKPKPTFNQFEDFCRSRLVPNTLIIQSNVLVTYIGHLDGINLHTSGSISISRYLGIKKRLPGFPIIFDKNILWQTKYIEMEKITLKSGDPCSAISGQMENLIDLLIDRFIYDLISSGR